MKKKLLFLGIIPFLMTSCSVIEHWGYLIIEKIKFGVSFNDDEERNRNKYYRQFQMSLEYIDEKEKISKVDLFTTKLEDVMKGNDPQATEFKKSFGNLGDKFFVAYVQQDCGHSNEAKSGFELFASKLNKDEEFRGADGDIFNMVTIFTDEVTSYTEDNETAFVKHLEKNASFYETVGAKAYDFEYYRNGKLNNGDLENLEQADPDNFLTPTIFLVELKGEAPGVTEIMFGVDGADDNAKAKTLLNCWNHTGDFSLDPND